MRYQPITENNSSKINYPVFTVSGCSCCWVFFMCLSRFGPSAVLKQIVQIHCVPKSVRIRHTALMDSKTILSKNYGRRSRIQQNSEATPRIRTQKPVANPQEIIGIVLTDCKSIGPEPLWIVMPGNSWIWTDQLSEVSSNFWQCALGLQKLPDVDWKLSDLSEIAGVAFLNSKIPLKIPRFACNICQTQHESPTIVLTKCKSLYPRQLAQEMWGCTLHAFLPTATTEKYSQSYRPYREIFLGN